MKVKTKILSQICTLTEDKLKEHLKRIRPNLKDCGTFLYSENPNNSVLAVAHMDVCRSISPAMFRVVRGGDTNIVLHPALDDRLGIFAILYLFPQFGITTDILLTTDEEVCMSTGQDFAESCPKKYNWIVELDRAGEDVVMYDYRDDEDLADDLKSVGFELGIGSYSDISSMQEMGVSAFNMGIGYHFQHSDQCCAVLAQLGRQLTRLKEFYNQFKDKAYKHEYVPPKIWYPTKHDFETPDWEDWLDEKEWEELYGNDVDSENLKGADTYWQDGRMHWSYVPPPRKSSYGTHRGKRLWAGHWDDNVEW